MKVLAALKIPHGKVKKVQLAIGIPDYDKHFSQLMPDIKDIKYKTVKLVFYYAVYYKYF